MRAPQNGLPRREGRRTSGKVLGCTENLAPKGLGAHDRVMQVERRIRRSHDPLVALHYQLAQARKEGKIDVLVVADPSGMVMAASGAWPLCEELAAYAPLLAAPASEMDEDGRIADLRPEVALRTVSIDSTPILLCALGCAHGDSAHPASSETMDRTAEGVRRILSQAA